MRIMVDDRERRAGVLEHLLAVPDVDVEVRRLPVGDYDAEGGVVFERKTVRDFAVSVMDGRLFDQARRLANGVPAPVCILEDASSVAALGGLSREAFQGALIALSVVFGIPVLCSESAEESAWLICAAARQVARRACGVVKRSPSRPSARRRVQLYILQGLPRIGDEKAGRLLAHFGSVEAAMEADEGELCEVEGIGPGTAAAIRWAVSESRPLRQNLEGGPHDHAK